MQHPNLLMLLAAPTLQPTDGERFRKIWRVRFVVLSVMFIVLPLTMAYLTYL